MGAFLFTIPKLKSIVGLFLKKFKPRVLPLFLLIGLAIIGAGFLWWRINTRSVVQQSSPTAFVVRKGEGLSSISQRLAEVNLVRSQFAFKLMVLAQGLSFKIQAGSFQLSPSLSAQEIAQQLTKGTTDIWLTFPEGWRREQYVQRLAANLANFDQQEFLSLTEKLEGQLFPDTYLMPQDASISSVLKIFEQNFEKKFTADLEKAAQRQGLTQAQVLILASLIEREAGQDKDRPIVGGILLKRWQNSWPLQIDATLQYIKGNSRDWWPQVYGPDKALNSTYNTYKYKGLPPGPICNPGLASIKGIIYPETTDYWFYLSDSKGQMHYSRTAKEHSANIDRFLR